MKKLLMALVLMPLMASADSEVVDGIEWSYLIVGGKAQIGSGQWASSAIPVETTGAVTIPSTLGGFPVRSIGICAFYGCDRMTSVTIPPSVKNVGDYAFYGCYSLLSATIPSSVTSIGPAAFDSCNILIVFVTDEPQECVKEYFGDEMLYQQIGTPINYEWDFSYADGLAAVTGVWPPIGNVVIPSVSNGCPVERIEEWAFGGCRGLASVTIPSSVKSVGDYAFYDCIGLTSVSVPDGVTNIGERAFNGCVGLTSVTIPPSVRSIGNEAFYYCSSLTSVTIPSSVNSVGDWAFCYCDGLTSVAISDGVTSIGDGAFYCCDGLASVTIPSSVTSIGNEAFYYCSGLMSVAFSEGLTSVGSEAFRGCSGLTSVTIPSSVTNIGDSAFAGCNGLTGVTIPSSVTSIGDCAFEWCSELRSVIISDGVTSLGDDAFSGCGRMRLMEFEGAPPVGFEYANIKRDVMLWYNVAYEEEWLTVLEECGFKNCMPYVPGERRPDGGPYVEFVDGIEWTYLIVDGEAYIGAGWDSRAVPWDTAGDVVVPTQLGGCEVRKINDGAFDNLHEITSVELPAGLTDIGANAFSHCDRLESVKIPNGVTNIGYQAFGSCASLSEIRLPVDLVCVGDAAFWGCSSLVAIDIPLGVTRIGMHAFAECDGLKSICIPPSAVSIGDYAFLSCGSLTVIEVDPDNANYASVDGVLYDKSISTLLACGGGKTALTIPSSVRTVEVAALSYCDNLDAIEVASGNANFISVEGVLYDKMHTTVIACGAGRHSVSICSSVTDIGICAFAGCDKLNDLKLPNGTVCIGDEAFSGCSGLTSIGIPNSVERIGDFAFSSCSGLTSVSIPSNVTSVGSYAFMGCSGLTSVTIPSGVISIGDYAFEGCSKLTSVTIPLSVTSIGEWAFLNCRGLTSVTISACVTELSTTFPSAYTEIKEVVILDGVTSIGDYVFSGCSGLESVTIPSSVTNVGEKAFSDCGGLTAVHIDDLAAWCGIGFDSADANPLYYAKKLYLNGKEMIRLNIPTGLEEVKPYAFYNCNRIMSVTIPTSVTRIGADAFRNCSGLTSMTIPSSVTEIGDGAFTYCSGIKTVTMPGRFALKEVFPSNYSSIRDVTILAGEKVLGKEVFAGCTGLKTVVISEGVTTLGEDLFYNLWNITELTIPSTVTSIGGYALYGCSLLKTIHVSNNGDIEALKQMLYESGFDTTGITFDHVKAPDLTYCKVALDVRGGSAAWTETEVVSGGSIGELPPATREGYEFLGWWTAAVGGTQMTAATVVTKDVTFYAQWKRIAPTPTGDDPEVFCKIKDEYGVGEDVGEIPVEVVNVDEPVKITVKGLPSGVTFKDGVITGAPKKSGVYAATVTVTPTSRGSAMAPVVQALTFVVRNPGEHVVVADYDAAQGSVKGMGVYAPGKKVTLKATAAKGWVFSEWRPAAEDGGGTNLASWSFTMPNEDVRVAARFVTVEEDRESIALEVNGSAFESAAESGGSTVSRDVVVKQGMYLEWPVVASTLSATTVKVSGLPSGLKFTAKDVKATAKSAAVPANTIYGTPKSASKVDKYGNVTPSKVKITVTTAGKQKQTYVINMTVRAIPAVGTFDGGGEDGIVTLTVAKTGKLSGKWLAGGKTWKLSASGFDTWDENDRLTATLTAKCGKEVKTLELVYEDGRVSTTLFEAWLNEWKTEPWKSLAAQLKGRKVSVSVPAAEDGGGTVDEDGGGTVELTVGGNGAVKAKGTFAGLDGRAYSASCSTVLIPTETEGQYKVYLYFPPKKGKFDGLATAVTVQ